MSRTATEQAPVKPSFARRCNLLSQYLKKNGNFGGLDLGLTRKPDSLHGFAGKPDPSGEENVMAKSETLEMEIIKPIDFIQKLGGCSPSDFSEPEQGTSELTIFFGGKVIVLNEFPRDKANEIMEMAKQANPATLPSAAVRSESMAEDTCKNRLKEEADNNGDDIVICSSSVGTSSKNNVVIPDLNEPTSSGNADNQQRREQNQLVERIARRASLHRFFAKRKDRAVARAPYQVTASPPPSSSERGQSSGQANDGVAAPLLKPKGHQDKSLEEEKEEGKCLKDLALRL